MKFSCKKYKLLFNLIVTAVLFLFSINLLINFFTVHTHTLADGTIVVHSHFSINSSEEDGSENHSHKAEEFESFYLASLMKIGELDNYQISIIMILFFISLISETIKKHQFGFTSSPTLRGPPQK